MFNISAHDLQDMNMYRLDSYRLTCQRIKEVFMRETWLYNLFTLSSIEIITCLIYDEESIFSTIYLLLSLFILIENFFFSYTGWYEIFTKSLTIYLCVGVEKDNLARQWYPYLLESHITTYVHIAQFHHAILYKMCKSSFESVHGSKRASDTTTICDIVD